MPKAVWNGVILAESEKTIVVEGNHYFPYHTIRQEYFQPNSSHTICPWKGIASYYDIVVNGQINRGGAWYYPDPKPAALSIKDHIAFWKGIRIVLS